MKGWPYLLGFYCGSTVYTFKVKQVGWNLWCLLQNVVVFPLVPPPGGLLSFFKKKEHFWFLTNYVMNTYVFKYTLYPVGKSIFLIINSGLNLVLAIELQNRISLAIQLSKPFKFDHRAVLVGGFNFLFTIKSLDLKMIINFCPYLRFRSFLRSRIRNGELYF